ncbi:MAG: hypothetical protein OQK55_06055, partial [Thermoanaerobaculales bacterium]|nr:hypothetical protein [Thermoanaerobaculales bacterium]
ARCSMLDARCSMLDARCSMLDARQIDKSRFLFVKGWVGGNSKFEIRNPKFDHGCVGGSRIEYPVSSIKWAGGSSIQDRVSDGCTDTDYRPLVVSSDPLSIQSY